MNIILSGVYFFDTWLRQVRKGLKEIGVRVCMQYHDELLFVCKKELKEEANKIIADSIELANKECQLNVELGCDTQWGNSYAAVH